MQVAVSGSHQNSRVRNSNDRSPAWPLLFGLLLTLLMVVAYSLYVTVQISGLRSFQQDFAGRNRKDSLQLLRIQNDLNSLALAMRDMQDGDEPYPLTAWRSQFQRLHGDLDNALHLEDQFAVAHRRPELRHYLAEALAQFWGAADRMFMMAEQGNATEAREQIRLSLQARQQALSAAVARLLVENTENEEQSSEQINHIYDRVQHHAYRFLVCTLAAILLTSLYLTYSNRRLFAKLSALSAQRRELAQKLITGQESTLRHLSRELHDEFGQILTAIGIMITRMHKQLPHGSSVHSDLLELQDITQSTLSKIRGLSQALHPVSLDEAGLSSTLDWYLPSLQRRTGLAIDFKESGNCFQLKSSACIHVFRILQEALSNAIRHSECHGVRVSLVYLGKSLLLQIEDNGIGIQTKSTHHGIGLVAMRERAELLGGKLQFLRPPQGGTLVRLEAPRAMVESDENEDRSPVPQVFENRPISEGIA